MLLSKKSIVGHKAIAWIVGVVLFGGALGAVSARRYKTRELDTKENAAYLYYRAAEEILGIPDMRPRTPEPDPHVVAKKNAEALELLQVAVKKERFDPLNVRVKGRPISLGRILEDMKQDALLMSIVARNTAQEGDWKAAMSEVDGVGKMAIQAGSYPSATKAAADLEALATKCWWSVVRRHADKPEAMRAGEKWLADFEEAESNTVHAGPANPESFDGYVQNGQPTPRQGLRPRKLVDPETANARRHAAVRAARVAFTILKTRAYRHPETMTAGLPNGSLVNPFTGGLMTVARDYEGFLVQCENPDNFTRRNGSQFMLNFRFSESKSDRWTNQIMDF